MSSVELLSLSSELTSTACTPLTLGHFSDPLKWFFCLHTRHVLPQAGHSSFFIGCFPLQNLHFRIFVGLLPLWSLLLNLNCSMASLVWLMQYPSILPIMSLTVSSSPISRPLQIFRASAPRLFKNSAFWTRVGAFSIHDKMQKFSHICLCSSQFICGHPLWCQQAQGPVLVTYMCGYDVQSSLEAGQPPHQTQKTLWILYSHSYTNKIAQLLSTVNVTQRVVTIYRSSECVPAVSHRR